MAYVLPQVQVFQVFTQLPQNVVQNLNAFVFGPHYQLFRYGVAAEKALIDLGTYDKDAVSTTYDYPSQPAGSTVDTGYTKLYLENVWAKYASLDTADGAQVSATYRNKIRVANVTLKTTIAGDRSAVLKTRDVRPGDKIRYAYGYDTGTSVIVALEADETAAAVGAATGSIGSAIVSGGSTFTGPKDTTYVLTVTSATAVRITDSAGTDGVQYVTPATGVAFDVGSYGATATITFSSLAIGDVAYIPCTIAVAGDVHTMVLEDDVNSAIDDGVNMDTVDIFLPQASAQITSKREQVTGLYDWRDVDGQLVVYQDMSVQDSSFYNYPDPTDMPWLPIDTADMFVEYRALLTDYSDTIHSLGGIELVTDTLGTVHPDNPLAQAVYNALLNSGDRPVYYMAVATDDLAGFSSVLERATLSSDVYAFSPVTRDSAILDAVQAHINSQSTETEKRWRIGFFGATAPTTKTVYNINSNPGNVDFLATVGNATPYGENLLVKFVTSATDLDPSPYTRCIADLKTGDKIRIGFTMDSWGEITYDEFEVDEVLTNASLMLKTGPTDAIVTPSKVEAYHPYTTAEMADAIAVLSSGYYSRRVYNVFPDHGSNAGIVQTSEFIAAAVAGLCSSVAPQQGLTNIELLGFDDLPMVYSTFNRTQLNKMAEYGTLIIMQDIVGGKVYVRHQVSTKASGNNLNETELSITKNLDSISYYFAGVLSPYIGRYNVTTELLGAIKTTLYDGLSYLGSYTNVGLLGPQIDLETTEIVTLQQHPTLKDTVVCTINVGMPAPFNVMQLSLVV